MTKDKKSKKIKAQKKTVSLRSRFILFFVTLATVPVLILSGISLYLIDQSHRHDVSNLELQVIDQTIDETRKFISDTSGILELRVAIEGELDIATSSQQFILTGLLEENKSFMEVSFIDRRGQETLKLTKDLIELELQNVTKLAHFKEAIAGETYTGDVFYTLTGPAVTLAAPVKSQDGEIIHVLAAEVNLSDLVKDIELTNFGGSGYVLLLDNDGQVIAQGSKQILMPSFGLKSFTRIQRVLRGETLDSLSEQDRYLSLVSQQPVVGAGRLIPELGWAVLVEWPLAEADALINDIRQQAALLTLLVILAVLLVAPLFASRLVKPIKQLQKSARSIEQGNFDHRVEIKTNDELAELGSDFNKMAQGLKRLQELKNEFVFVAAHELRSPVTAIKGYLSMIKEESGNLSENINKMIDIVYKSNNRLVQLVDDLLSIARSDAGKLKITVAPTSLKAAIQAVVMEAQPLAAEKQISLTYKTAGAAQVMADEGRIKEIAMNFISNAIKYNRDGGFVKIYHETKGTTIITHIEDNGFGISPKDQQHMFEKFFRSEADIYKDVSGTGLGMFITKQIIEKMNGKVWFVSEQGQGSTFSFSLPKV